VLLRAIRSGASTLALSSLAVWSMTRKASARSPRDVAEKVRRSGIVSMPAEQGGSRFRPAKQCARFALRPTTTVAGEVESTGRAGAADDIAILTPATPRSACNFVCCGYGVLEDGCRGGSSSRDDPAGVSDGMKPRRQQADRKKRRHKDHGGGLESQPNGTASCPPRSGEGSRAMRKRDLVVLDSRTAERK